MTCLNTSLGRHLLVFLLYLFLCIFFPIHKPAARATTQPELVEKEADIIQNLDAQVDLSLEFVDAEGRKGTLKSFFPKDGRPVIFAPVYYKCPRLCSLTLNGVATLINELEFELGRDYKVIALSFNSEEGPELAKEKAKNYYQALKFSDRGPVGWEFLTGSKENVSSVMNQLGFHYMPDGKEFTHAAAIMLLTPAGRISRYFFGVEYPSSQVRYSLVEASEGRIGSVAEHIFLYCFRFDPTKGKYTLIVWNFTRAVCATVVVLLALFLFILRKRENEPRFP